MLTLVYSVHAFDKGFNWIVIMATSAFNGLLIICMFNGTQSSDLNTAIKGEICLEVATPNLQ